MKSPDQSSSAPVSWPLLLAISGVITGTAALMVRNVIYTEGEVMQPVFGLLVVILGLMPGVGFFNRTWAAWLILTCGGAMILWQANQTRRWGILHEEIFGIVAYAENVMRSTGSYPPDLGAIDFFIPGFAITSPIPWSRESSTSLTSSTTPALATGTIRTAASATIRTESGGSDRRHLMAPS